MHIPRKPGQQIEVDWAGDPAHIIDPDTGEITDAWIFVGVMTYSQYAFVKAYMDEKTNNWIKAHIQMFVFFGEYSCAMKSHFRKFGNQMSGSGNHLCKYTSLLA